MIATYNSQRGSVMMLAMIALIIMLITGALVLQLARGNLGAASANKERTIALQAAEAGIDFTIAQLELHPEQWATLIESNPDLFQNHRVGNAAFTVDPIEWQGARVARITSKGWAKEGGRVVSVVRTVRLFAGGWRYALFAEGSIEATGNSSVYGSMHSNSHLDISTAGITTGGSFNWTPLLPTDLAESYGPIDDARGRIPDEYEWAGADYVDLPDIAWQDFQDPLNFPGLGVTVYNVRQADEAHPKGTVVKEANGSYSYYWEPQAGGNPKKPTYNISVTVSEFNSWFTARDGNPNVIVNWLAGIPTDGGGYDYTLHLTGNGTITATLVVPDLPPSNSSVKLSGGVSFQPRLGIAILTDTVDMSKVNGTVDLGTPANPALVLATGGVQFGAAGTMQANGSVVIGGDPATSPDIDIKGNASFTWNPGFIDRIPEQWQNFFTGGSWSVLPVAWQQLGAGA